MDKAILYRWLWLYSASFLNGCMIWTDCVKRQRLKFECVVSKEERDLPLRVGVGAAGRISVRQGRGYGLPSGSRTFLLWWGMVLGFNRFNL